MSQYTSGPVERAKTATSALHRHFFLLLDQLQLLCVMSPISPRRLTALIERRFL